MTHQGVATHSLRTMGQAYGQVLFCVQLFLYSCDNITQFRIKCYVAMPLFQLNSVITILLVYN